MSLVQTHVKCIAWKSNFVFSWLFFGGACIIIWFIVKQQVIDASVSLLAGWTIEMQRACIYSIFECLSNLLRDIPFEFFQTINWVVVKKKIGY